VRPNERRRKILGLLNLRRNDTMQHLAEEFGVSRMTIYRDLLVLAEEYPIIHTMGRGGGISLPNGYYLSRKYLSPDQADALRRNLNNIAAQDREIFQSILNDFAWSD